MTTHATCHLCARPSGDDANACTACADHARAALRRVIDGLDTDLTTTLAKQGTRPTGPQTRRGRVSEAPLPLNLAAVEARDILHTTLRAWVNTVLTDVPTATRPRDTLAGLAAWLLPMAGWLRHRTYGPDALDELAAAVDQAVRAVDTPVERVGVGRCPHCHSPVYAPATRLIAYCHTPDCEGTVDVQQWQQSLQQLAWGHEAGATELAAFATKHLGMRLAAGTIRSWASRGHLHRTNPGEDTPRYRFADIATLAGRQEVSA